MLVHVPYCLTCQSEHILVGCVLVLIQIPVWVLVILVITVPVSVSTISILIVLQPFLVIGTCKRHEVLAHVALRIAKSRTVVHTLVSVVGCEVEIHRTNACIDTEVEVIAVHVCVRQNVAVTHICHREADACLATIHREYGGILCRETSTEEVGSIVGVHIEWMYRTVEICLVDFICLCSPALVSARRSIKLILAIITHTVDGLDVIPLGKL